MAKKKKTRWTFDIGREDYDLANGGEAYRPVLLDGKEIYRIDKTKFMGFQRGQNKEIIEAIKLHTKIELTPEQLNKAFTIGSISKV